jgi:gliding motility-associated-like protein
MEDQKIEQLFRSGLGNLESDVHPEAWKNISKELQKPEDPAAAITPSGKLSSMSQKFILKMVVIGVVVTAVLATTISYLSNKNSADVNTTSSTTTKVNSVKPSVQSQTPVMNEAPKTESNAPATTLPQKQTETKQAVQNSSPSMSSTASASRVKAPRSVKIGPDTKTQVYMLTPDGDGENDSFKPMLDGKFKEYELTILDPKGKEVFKAKDSSAQWDGRLDNGQSAPAQVYTYVVKAKDLANTARSYTGTVALVR